MVEAQNKTRTPVGCTDDRYLSNAMLHQPVPELLKGSTLHFISKMIIWGKGNIKTTLKTN